MYSIPSPFVDVVGFFLPRKCHAPLKAKVLLCYARFLLHWFDMIILLVFILLLFCYFSYFVLWFMSACVSGNFWRDTGFDDLGQAPCGRIAHWRCAPHRGSGASGASYTEVLLSATEHDEPTAFFRRKTSGFSGICMNMWHNMLICCDMLWCFVIVLFTSSISDGCLDIASGCGFLHLAWGPWQYLRRLDSGWTDAGATVILQYHTNTILKSS